MWIMRCYTRQFYECLCAVSVISCNISTTLEQQGEKHLALRIPDSSPTGVWALIISRILISSRLLIKVLCINASCTGNTRGFKLFYTVSSEMEEVWQTHSMAALFPLFLLAQNKWSFTKVSVVFKEKPNLPISYTLLWSLFCYCMNKDKLCPVRNRLPKRLVQFTPFHCR